MTLVRILLGALAASGLLLVVRWTMETRRGGARGGHRRGTDAARTSHRVRHKFFRHARHRLVRDHHRGISTLPPGSRRVDPGNAHRRSRAAGADAGAALHQRRPRRSLADDDAHRGLRHWWVDRRGGRRLPFAPRGAARHGLRAAGCRRVHDARHARPVPGGRHRARLHTARRSPSHSWSTSCWVRC